MIELYQCLYPERLKISYEDKKLKLQAIAITQDRFGGHVIRKSIVDIDSKSPTIVEIVDYRRSHEK